MPSSSNDSRLLNGFLASQLFSMDAMFAFTCRAYLTPREAEPVAEPVEIADLKAMLTGATDGTAELDGQPRRRVRFDQEGKIRG
jgi:hypothetical protein